MYLSLSPLLGMAFAGCFPGVVLQKKIKKKFGKDLERMINGSIFAVTFALVGGRR